MEGSFPPHPSAGFGHPMSTYHGDVYAMKANHQSGQWQTWQGSHPYNAPSPTGPMPSHPYGGFHPTTNAWYPNYGQATMGDYYTAGPSRYPMEPPMHDGDYRRPPSHSSRGRSRSRGQPKSSDEERSRPEPTSLEGPGRSSSRTKRSLAKSVYVDDLSAPKEPGTRPLSLRELADFDFNEKGHLVVKEHSSHGQPSSVALPHPAMARSRTPSPSNSKGKEHARDEPLSDDPASVRELKSEVARLKAELQAQQEENARRQSEETKAMKAELEKLQQKNDALGHKESRTNQQVALKEEELDLVRIRLEKIAQQMSEIRSNQCSRPRSERRGVRSASQGLGSVSGRSRRSPPRTRFITGGPGDSVDWRAETAEGYNNWDAPPEGTLLYRTVDENGHEVEYREVAVIRHAPGERKVVSERYFEHTPSSKYHMAQKVKSASDLRPSTDGKRSTDLRKPYSMENKGVPELPPSLYEKVSAKRYDSTEDETTDDWEMPTTPKKPSEATSPVQAWSDNPSPSKPLTKPSATSRAKAADSTAHGRNPGRGHLPSSKRKVIAN
eukprot:GGOE01008413.1.p1 GENE.GGOE01008413.1~~GGOE01008413.1.p1  ORF type:complete len:553 (-),score=46.13 GGOE01008413.1:804-2462(-)